MTMPLYKLVALDMDGTLLNEENEITKENRQAIELAMAGGTTVIIATGRGVQSALPYIEDLGLQTPVVAVNGGEVWKSPSILWHRQLMDWQMIRELHALALRYDTWYWAYAVNGLFNKEKWVERIEEQEWLKFGFYSEDDQIRSEIMDILKSSGSPFVGNLEISNSDIANIEINPIGVNKANGVRQVCDLLDIQMSQVMAVGDSLNDISMIRAAGLGVAMGNAQDAVKEAADQITLRNSEHGVAEAIRRFVLGHL